MLGHFPCHPFLGSVALIIIFFPNSTREVLARWYMTTLCLCTFLMCTRCRLGLYQSMSTHFFLKYIILTIQIVVVIIIHRRHRIVQDEGTGLDTPYTNAMGDIVQV